MIEFPLLTILTFLPLVGAFFIMTIRGDEQNTAANAKWTALWTSGATFILSRLYFNHVRCEQRGFSIC